jgi:hypothetical protein
MNWLYEGCGIKSQFLKNCGKQFDVCLFKHFGSKDEVAMGTERFILHRVAPSGTVLLPELRRAVLRGAELFIRCGNSYTSNYYSIFSLLKSRFSFDLIIEKDSNCFLPRLLSLCACCHLRVVR